MRLFILLAIVVCAGCSKTERVALWTEAQAIELHNDLIATATKLDQAIILSAEAVNSVSCLTEEISGLKSAIQQIQVQNDPVQSVLIPNETVTAEQVREIISEALKSFEHKFPTPIEAALQPAKVEPAAQTPTPFQPTQNVTYVCSGGVCQPVQTVTSARKKRFLGRWISR